MVGSCVIPGCIWSKEKAVKESVSRSFFQILRPEFGKTNEEKQHRANLTKFILCLRDYKKGDKMEEKLHKESVAICDTHFNSEDIILFGNNNKRKLRLGAMPCLNLPKEIKMITWQKPLSEKKENLKVVMQNSSTEIQPSVNVLLSSLKDIATEEVKYKKSLVEKIFSLLTEREFCDMEIISGGHSYFCTKLILAAASPVFYSIIKAASEDCFKNGIYTIVINFISGKVIEKLLKYYYTGQKPTEEQECADEFYKATEIFRRTDLNAQSIDDLRPYFGMKVWLPSRKRKLKKQVSNDNKSVENEGIYLIKVQAEKPKVIPVKKARYTQNRLNLPKKPPFSCPCENCGKIFETREKLRSHYRHNHGEKKYKCSECPLRFLYPKDLRGHTRTHTGERPFVCEVCGKRFSHSSVLVHHAITHSKPKDDNSGILFPCSSCRKQYSFQNTTTNLIEDDDFDASSLICPNSNCAKKFAATRSLRKHLRNRVCYVGQPKCAGCSRNFDSMVMLRKHIAEIHCTHKNKQRRVKLSQILSENEENPKSDVSTPVVTNKIQCALCGSLFQEQSEYDKHVIDHHENNADVVPIQTTENGVSIELDGLENNRTSSEPDSGT